MNPYPERLEELHLWLESRYGQRDQQATEILLTGLLDPAITRMRRPWFIIETDYPNRDTFDAWFAFGGEAVVRSMAVPRVLRAPKSEDMLREWIYERPRGLPGLFVDAEWRRLPSNNHAGLLNSNKSYATFLSMCLRLRVAHPRGMQSMLPNRDVAKSELARLTRRVLDSSLRPTQTWSETAANPPASLLYWCELLQKVAPYQTDWEALTGGLAAVARGIAALYNDGRQPDWQASERVLRDCVPYTTSWIIEQTSIMRRDARKRAVNADCNTAQAGIAMDKTLYRECKRLNLEGVILVRDGYSTGLKGKRSTGALLAMYPWRYKLGSQDYKELVDRKRAILI